jgi:hypothetical protein
VRRETQNRVSVALAAIALAGAAVTAAAAIQKLTPAEVAAKMSGTWVLNRELTTGFNAPKGAPGRGGGGRGGNFGVAGIGAPPAQRGGGAGPSTASDASDMTADERAAMMAMRELQQISELVSIKATETEIAFADARGQRSYMLDGKGVKIVAAGTDVSVKSRWDKAIVKQEFSTASSKLIQTWTVDENERLVMTAKVESLRLRTPEQKAVFDRKTTP